MNRQVEGIDYENYLTPWIGRTVKMAEDYFTLLMDKYEIDLTKRQWLILNYVKTSGGMSQKELALCSNRDKTSVTRMISALEKKNFLARIASPEDKRSNTIIITKQGEKIIAEALPVIKAAIEEFQEGLSLEDVHKAIETLKKLQNKIEQMQLVACETK